MEQPSGHVNCDVDKCLKCKLAYWRANGAPAVRIPHGWRGPSVQALARQEVADAAAAGRQIESTMPHYAGPVSV